MQNILLNKGKSSIFIFVFCFTIFYSAKIVAQNLYKTVTNEYKLSDFKGSPYFEDSFKKGVINDGLSSTKKNVFLRYDVYSDIFEMKNMLSDKSIDFVRKSSEIKVDYGNRKFIYHSYRLKNGNVENGYLEKVANLVDVIIYRKNKKELVMPQKAKSSMEKGRSGKIRNQEYYLVGKNDQIQQQDLNKKSVLDLFDKENSAKVKIFIKNEKLKFKENEDFKSLENFLQTL